MCKKLPVSVSFLLLLAPKGYVTLPPATVVALLVQSAHSGTGAFLIKVHHFLLHFLIGLATRIRLHNSQMAAAWHKEQWQAGEIFRVL